MVLKQPEIEKVKASNKTAERQNSHSLLTKVISPVREVRQGFFLFQSNSMELIDSIDIGEEVICDYCNRTITDEDSEGFFVGTNAVCADCGKDIRVSDYEKFGVSHISKDFKQAVLHKRNGNNCIEIYSY
jgi:hypothetical protein